MLYDSNYCNVRKKCSQLSQKLNFSFIFLTTNDLVGCFLSKRLLCDLLLQIHQCVDSLQKLSLSCG